MNRILIVGATGVLGSEAAKHFLKKGFQVKCFVRNKEKAAELASAGGILVVGDLTNEASIVNACKDVDVVIAAAHGMLGKGKNKSENVDDAGHKALVKAAVEANVQHFIYTSVSGLAVDHPIDFLRTKYAIEQLLVSSGLNYTILRLPAFMEWHAHRLLGKSIMDKGKVTILGSGENPTNFIAVDDIVQALNIIVGNQAYFNKTINVAGPENISKNEVANIYGRLSNKTPKVSHVPVGVLKVMSAIINPFHPGIGRIMKFSAYTDKADATMNVNDSVQQFGLRPTTMEEFIKKQVSQ